MSRLKCYQAGIPERAREHSTGIEDSMMIKDDNEAHQHEEKLPTTGNQPAMIKVYPGIRLTQIGTVKGNMTILIIKNLRKDSTQDSIRSSIMQHLIIDLSNYFRHQ